ncbi:hypothetical protein PUR61_16120, partial [Streptomyces sp. BE20]|uniref:hypothetical protein n=1 Tax=Streptomyces sp. BE20 TaxID=3002525 RepID=UPI002E79E89B
TKILFKGTFGKIGVKGLRWDNYDRVTRRTPAERRHIILDTEQRSTAHPPHLGPNAQTTRGHSHTPQNTHGGTSAITPHQSCKLAPPAQPLAGPAAGGVRPGEGGHRARGVPAGCCAGKS